MSKRPERRSRKTASEGITIPDRHRILAYLKSSKKPRTLQHIADNFGVRSSAARAALNNRLKAMLRDGEVIKNRREGYGLVEKMDLIAGTVMGHPDGYGFLRPDHGDEDLYLSVKEMRSLLHGDRAVVRIRGYDRKGRAEGALVEVLDRANQRIVGRFYLEDKVGYVVPDNKRIHQDIFIPRENRGKAQSGEYVVAEIERQPDQHTQPVGRIIEILRADKPVEMAAEIAIRSFELPYQWPDGVTAEIKKLDPDRLPAIFDREDLRNLPFVTIDGEDARDFDDAVYCERKGNGWRLLVAIADVSYYVEPGTALDDEARLRGTSVYFPQRVIPMLPEVLSNGLCSLNPDTDRLCLVCELSVNNKGKVKHYRFLEAIMRSQARLTYTETAAMIVERKVKPRRRYKSLLPHLEDLFILYKQMHKRRTKQGLLDFDATESAIRFDDTGHVTAIQPLIRNDAHRLIEEFMLAANVAAADFLIRYEMPALFRNHESPDQDKLEDLREFLREFGLSLGGGDTPTARDYADLIGMVSNRDDAHLIETVLLKSMQLAVYSETNGGHFGLAFDAYTHFTSPIRRYPDLIVHRAIRRVITGGSPQSYPYSRQDMHLLGESCSMAERRAEEASRNVVQRLKCEFMHDKVGEEFYGTVSGVTAFGLFVELDGIFVEGLIHVTSLPIDYYHFDAVGHRLKGERTGRSYRLANRLKVKVMRVNVDDGKIDFELV